MSIPVDKDDATGVRRRTFRPRAGVGAAAVAAAGLPAFEITALGQTEAPIQGSRQPLVPSAPAL